MNLSGRVLKLVLCVGLFSLAGFFMSVSGAQAAASLYLTPAGGSFEVGSTFSVSMILDTGDQPVNAIEANLTFPADKLQIVPSAPSGNSIIKIWVTQPKYSNSDGTVKLQGAIPNPGIRTDSGLLSTLTFRAKNTGQAAIKFLDSSKVFLNDGKATDILTRTSGGIYELTLPPPEGPIVTSRTNPDQGKWYQSRITVLEWTAPSDIQGYSYLMDDDPGTIPDKISEGMNTRVSFDSVSDGIHYFHIRALRQNVWGGVTTYEAKIDRTPPAQFPVSILPSDYTTRRTPVISFSTTDEMSGFDHFELAIIALDKNAADDAESPLFVEVSSPHINTFGVGNYHIIVRAYDKAGNRTQVEPSLTIVNPIFEIIGRKGIQLGGTYMLGWGYAIAAALCLLAILFFVARLLWNAHARIEERLRHGASLHHSIAPKLDELKKKQSEYGGSIKKLPVIFGILFIGVGLLLMGGSHAYAQDADLQPALESPLITLFPKSASNDEIVYVGGTVSESRGNVLLYVQHVESLATTAHTVIADGKGDWFFTFPDFLSSGHYVIWTQLKSGEMFSPPSARVDLTVAPTALQLGRHRFSAQQFYLLLFLLFFAACVGLVGFIAYHGYHAGIKRRRLRIKLKEADESIRRGFALLHRDIKAELAVIHKMRRDKHLSSEELRREEKLTRDLESVSRHLGKEIWDIGREMEK